MAMYFASPSPFTLTAQSQPVIIDEVQVLCNRIKKPAIVGGFLI